MDATPGDEWPERANQQRSWRRLLVTIISLAATVTGVFATESGTETLHRVLPSTAGTSEVAIEREIRAAPVMDLIQVLTAIRKESLWTNYNKPILLSLCQRPDVLAVPLFLDVLRTKVHLGPRYPFPGGWSHEFEDEVIQEVVRALGALRDPRTYLDIRVAARDADNSAELQKIALEEASRFDLADPVLRSVLLTEALKTPTASHMLKQDVREEAVHAIGEGGDDDSINKLVEALRERTTLHTLPGLYHLFAAQKRPVLRFYYDLYHGAGSPYPIDGEVDAKDAATIPEAGKLARLELQSPNAEIREASKRILRLVGGLSFRETLLIYPLRSAFIAALSLALFTAIIPVIRRLARRF